MAPADLITYFSPSSIEGIELPKHFTFPFFYEPHPLSIIAAKHLQQYLEQNNELKHNFGLIPEQEGIIIGKMFGVLVVEDMNNQLGYLWAFSGKLAGTNLHKNFVPPVFDMLTEDSFFLQKEEVLNRINAKIQQTEEQPAFIHLKTRKEVLTQQAQEEINLLKQQVKENKASRKQLREQQKDKLSATAYSLLEKELIKESLTDKRKLLQLTQKWLDETNRIQIAIDVFNDEIISLKKERKEKSALLQQQLFDQYSFLNQYGEVKSLAAIFRETTAGKPPAAAGECATPKLLQYAFLNGYKPLAMAEFWWGASPKSEIRKHQQYYPACTGKCQPILKHMLQGVVTDDNPFLKNMSTHQGLSIVYEDSSFVIVNKPAELLSVPGIHIQDSVYLRLKQIWVTIEPLIIHRLDMATSGLLVVAKTKEAHKHIQKQFLKRTVMKRYTAIVSGIVEKEEGKIELPLRGDMNDRPRQLVCFEEGKKAVTLWKVVERKNNTSRLHLWPLTGRTHQLRMHTAHPLGLNAPIIGDDLYGTPNQRLYLHAAFLQFRHPVSREIITFTAEEDF